MENGTKVETLVALLGHPAGTRGVVRDPGKSGETVMVDLVGSGSLYYKPSDLKVIG